MLIRRVREARQAAGMTQRAVAARIGKPQSYIHKWECGQRQLNPIDLRDLCEAMGVSFVDFIKQLDEELSKERSRK